MKLVYQRAHYPRKTGSTGASGEQAMSVAVGDWVKKLTPPGWTVSLINADVADSAYKGDAFVACHGDGHANRAATGASAGYQNNSGDILAQAWKRAYVKRGWARTFRSDNYTANLRGYYGVRKAIAAGNKRAAIIEVGFMTNKTDRAWIDANHKAIAESIWDAVAPGWEKKPLPYPGYVIKPGAKGPNVRWIQRRLIAHGYKLPKYGVDGDFGNETAAAVMKFRKACGFRVGKSVGRWTWGRLAKEAK